MNHALVLVLLFAAPSTLAKPKPQTALSLFAQAKAHFTASRFTKAIPLLRQVIKKNNKNAEAHWHLGLSCGATRNLQCATETLETLTRLKSTFPAAWTELGYTYLKRGMNEKAKKALLKSQKLNPKDRFLLLNMGRLHSAFKAYNAALKPLAQCRKLYPKFYPCIAVLGITYGKTKKFKKAVDTYGIALKMKPEDLLVRFNYAVALGNLRRDQAACKAYKAYLKAAGKKPSERRWVAQAKQNRAKIGCKN
jgi:Flp pilus assembly protein TadD